MTDPYRIPDRLDRGKTPTAAEATVLRDALTEARTNRDRHADARLADRTDELAHALGRDRAGDDWEDLIEIAAGLPAADRDARAARQGETEAVRARQAAEEAAAEARANEFERAGKDAGRHVELADALGLQAQRGMLAWPALIKAVRTLQALKDDHRRRAEQAEAAITRVRAELDRIAALPVVTHVGSKADRFGIGSRWTLRMLRAALDGSRELATGAAYGPDADDARPWIAEALGLDIETSWGVIADAARTMRRDLAEARNAADPCAHGCRDAADEHTRLSQELDAEAEPEPQQDGLYLRLCRMLGTPADTPDDDLIEAVRGLLVRDAQREQPAEPLLRGTAPLVISIDLSGADIAAVIRRIIQRPPGGRP